jgi:class 3 adenylate cyclase
LPRFEDQVGQLLADAEGCAEQADWDGVRALARAALSLVPDDPDAQRLLEAADSASPTLGERRQLTVMFCDVVGSTSMSHRRDPELVHEVLRSYQIACDEAVRRYGGRIARYIGDGVLAYFGHPAAHEDDARRAVKAGLDLLDALRPITDEVRARYEIDLSIRVAVHTGLVVVADMGSSATPDHDAIVGETPNLAARLQDRATPGTLIISDATYDLVRGWFLVLPLGTQPLKGIDRPVDAFQVVEETEIDSRIHAQADLSPFVGRAEEVVALDEVWAEVEAGGSRAVVIRGAPGIGKSRLADVARRRIEARGGSTIETCCSTYHTTTALFPVRRLIERAAGIDAHHDEHQSLSRLWQSLDQVGLADALPLLAALLGLPPEPWCPAPELEGAKLREQTLASLMGWISTVAARSPVLLFVDDLQWADPSTIELLTSIIVNAVPGVLLLATMRDDAPVPWSAASVVELDRLSPLELEDLAGRLPEGRSLGEDHLREILERSDGMPLFLEELLRTARQATPEATSRSQTSIPAALRDHLLARFAVPGADLHLAQLVATIGGAAPRSLIVATSNLPEATLETQLDALVGSGILDLVSSAPPVYQFHHQLLADLAYDTQVRAARERTHDLVAQALLRSGAREPAVVAHHLEQAGRYEEAVELLTEAAESAVAFHAVSEMTELLDHAFELLELVAPTRRADLEFQVRLVRGTAVASQLGYAAPATSEDYQACLDLAPALAGDGFLDEAVGGRGPATELVWSATGLWAAFMLQARLDDADGVIDALAAQLRPGSEYETYFRTTQWLSDFFRGRHRQSLVMVERSLALLHHLELPPRLAMPSDPKSVGLSHLAFLLALQGKGTEAREQIELALVAAREIPFPRGPFSVCYITGLQATMEILLGDVAATHGPLDEQEQLADRHGFTFWQVLSSWCRAFIELEEGDAEAAPRAEMMLQLLQSMGVVVWLPSFYGGMAFAHLRQGRPDEARRLLAEGTRVADETGAHLWTAELLRLTGEVHLCDGDIEGLAVLREAKALAVDQGADLLELRCTTSIAAHSDDPADGLELAAALEGWAGDLDLRDVVEARAVLAAHG